MWVADNGDDKIYAYTLSDRERDDDEDFTTLGAAGNTIPQGIWSDGTTMWVADDDDNKVYAYNMPPSSDATLRALSVSPKDIIGFDAGRSSYQVGVDSTETMATVTAVPNHPGASVSISPDADTNTDDAQVPLSAGRNLVTITVTATDSSTRTYTVSVNRGVTDAKGWKAGSDLDGLIAAGNLVPVGIWSNGETMWIAYWREDKLYAYRLTDGSRDDDEDIALSADNASPEAIWSNRETMWVVDGGDDKLYAYNMANGSPDAVKDINLAADNQSPKGIWSDGVTVWVGDIFSKKLYAYSLLDGERDSTQDFDTLRAARNLRPRGIWSDGTTMWVSDGDDDKLYAYSLSDGERDSTQDFDTLRGAGNESPSVIWSDGTTMWVADGTDDKLYAYNMPGVAEEARLRDLTLSGVPLGETFDRDDFDYTAYVPAQTTQTTVTAVTLVPGATAVIKVNGVVDTDGTVDLVVGDTVISVEVTAVDGITMRTYTVTVTVVDIDIDEEVDWPATTDTTAVMAPGGRIKGCINRHRDVDWIRVTFTAGQVLAYVVRVEGRDSGFVTLIDPELSGIYDSVGVRISDGDLDSGPGQEALLVWTPPRSGVFYFEVSESGGWVGQCYQLSLTRFNPDDAPGVPRNLDATSIEPVTPVSPNAVLTFKVELEWSAPADDQAPGLIYGIQRRYIDRYADGHRPRRAVGRPGHSGNHLHSDPRVEANRSGRRTVPGGVPGAGGEERSRRGVDGASARGGRVLSATADSRAAGQAYGPDRNGRPRLQGVPDLGRPGRRRHNRLSDTAAEPGHRRHRRFHGYQGRHRVGRRHLHRRHGGARNQLCLSDQGAQRRRPE